MDSLIRNFRWIGSRHTYDHVLWCEWLETWGKIGADWHWYVTTGVEEG